MLEMWTTAWGRPLSTLPPMGSCGMRGLARRGGTTVRCPVGDHTHERGACNDHVRRRRQCEIRWNHRVARMMGGCDRPTGTDKDGWKCTGET